MSIKTVSQSQLGQDTAKNSQIVTTAVKLVNSGASTGPSISSIIVTDSGYNNLDDTAAATSNSYIKILGSGFTSTANVFLNGTMVPKANVTFVSSSELRAALPVSNTGNYAISVYNSNSAGALHSSSFTISTMPQWLTSSNLESKGANTAFSFSLSATSDSTVTYSNTTALPAGTTLAANGLFSGSISTQTTYSFDVKATDAENQDTTRTFNLTIVSPAIPIEYLVVAGGGGGAADDGGGGGAGGMRTGSLSITPGITYTVTVGGGGTFGTRLSDPEASTAGSSSVFGEIVSVGGGAGHRGGPAPPKSNGGSGGGGGYSAGVGGTGIAQQGNAGGPAGSFTGAGGGGGAGAAGDAGQSGASSPTMNAGNGGAGLSSSISGTSIVYAGGGGGGSRAGGGAGGNGGGGRGGTTTGVAASGTINRGGGGGGAGDVPPSDTANGGAGGSGIVIIRYPDTYPAATSATNGTVTVSGGYRIYTWTSSGTFTH